MNENRESFGCRITKMKEPIHQDDAWPLPRSGHRMCADSNFLYVFGGYKPDHPGKTFNELWRYNTSSGAWLLMPDEQGLIPKASASSSMLLSNKCIFIFGGTGFPFALTNSNQISMYGLAKKQWYDLSTAPARRDLQKYPIDHITTKSCGCRAVYDSLPVKKYGQGMALSKDDHKLFICSGTTGQTFTKELHSFCLKSFSWMEHQLCPHHGGHHKARYRHEVASYRTKFYVFGGATLSRYFGLENITSFDFVDEEWQDNECFSKCSQEQVTVFPAARKAHSCVTWDGKVYMIGGMSFERGSLNDFWVFDLETKTWDLKQKLSLPKPLHFHSAAVTTDGRLYVFGGVSKNDKRVSDLYKIHLALPTLKRLAWIKTVQCLKAANRFNSETLKELRIPKEYLQYTDEVKVAAG